MGHKKQNVFDENVNFYFHSNSILYEYDYYLLDFIKESSDCANHTLLDIGGGGGVFAKLVVDNCINIKVSVVDPSRKLLDNIHEDSIEKVVGMLPNQLSINEKFDYIHVKEVFHHVTGSSIRESKSLLKESLQTIKKLLNDDGYLLIHELFYESPIHQTFSSSIIYYLCKIQNKIGIKIPMKEFLLGLDVYFYTRKEFIKILNDMGFEIVNYYEVEWKKSHMMKLIGLKNWGRMVFVCRKIE